MTMTKAKRAEQEEAIARLRAWINPGDTIYTTLTHKSSSGMYRAITMRTIKPDPTDRRGISIGWLSYNVAEAGIGRWDERHEAVGVSGAGMDMGFHLVYELAYTLFPDGFDCVGVNCPSNEHSNGDTEYTPHHHASGGYALRHEWL